MKTSTNLYKPKDTFYMLMTKNFIWEYWEYHLELLLITQL